MPELFKGVVGFNPDFRYSKTGKGLLKFILLRDGDSARQIPVVVFGEFAEQHQKLAKGQGVVITGVYELNSWGGDPQMELKVFKGKGNFKLTGEKLVALVAVGEEHPFWEDDQPEYPDYEPSDEDCQRDILPLCYDCLEYLQHCQEQDA